MLFSCIEEDKNYPTKHICFYRIQLDNSLQKITSLFQFNPNEVTDKKKKKKSNWVNDQALVICKIK